MPDMRDLKTALENFKLCVQNAPERTYEDAKRLDRVLGETCDTLIREVRSIGLKANNSDLMFELEAFMYNWVRRANPQSTTFPVAEGFGSSMKTQARERVIAQAESNRDFIEGLPSGPGL